MKTKRNQLAKVHKIKLMNMNRYVKELIKIIYILKNVEELNFDILYQNL
jgi:hypothetical protein